MNVVEIAEHWPSIAESCRLRWSLQAGVSRAELVESVGNAWRRSLGEVLAAHSSEYTSSDSSSSSSGGGSCVSSSSSEGDGVRGSGGGMSAVAKVTPYAAVLEAFKAVASSGSASSTSSNASSNASSGGAGSGTGLRVAVLSDLPHSLASAVMAQLGLSVDDVPLVAGYSWRLGTCAAADAAGAGALPSSSGAHGGHGGGGGSAVAAAAAEAAAALAEGRGAVVSGGIVRLEAAAQRLGRQREQAQEQQERAQQQAQQAQGQQAQQQQERQTQGQGQAQQAQAQEEEQQQARRRSGPSSSTAPSLGGARLAPGKGPCTTTLFLADWACPHISMHARALSHGTLLGLLSEHELATVMGVEDLDVVMDGIAWR